MFCRHSPTLHAILLPITCQVAYLWQQTCDCASTIPGIPGTHTSHISFWLPQPSQLVFSTRLNLPQPSKVACRDSDDNRETSRAQLGNGIHDRDTFLFDAQIPPRLRQCTAPRTVRVPRHAAPAPHPLCAARSSCPVPYIRCRTAGNAYRRPYSSIWNRSRFPIHVCRKESQARRHPCHPNRRHAAYRQATEAAKPCDSPPFRNRRRRCNPRSVASPDRCPCSPQSPHT